MRSTGRGARPIAQECRPGERSNRMYAKRSGNRVEAAQDLPSQNGNSTWIGGERGVWAAIATAVINDRGTWHGGDGHRSDQASLCLLVKVRDGTQPRSPAIFLFSGTREGGKKTRGRGGRAARAGRIAQYPAGSRQQTLARHVGGVAHGSHALRHLCFASSWLVLGESADG